MSILLKQKCLISRFLSPNYTLHDTPDTYRAKRSLGFRNVLNAINNKTNEIYSSDEIAGAYAVHECIRRNYRNTGNINTELHIIDATKRDCQKYKSPAQECLKHLKEIGGQFDYEKALEFLKNDIKKLFSYINIISPCLSQNIEEIAETINKNPNESYIREKKAVIYAIKYTIIDNLKFLIESGAKFNYEKSLDLGIVDVYEMFKESV